jgi:hypothetical protein
MIWIIYKIFKIRNLDHPEDEINSDLLGKYMNIFNIIFL